MSNEFRKFLVDPDAIEPRHFTEVPLTPPVVVSKAPSGYTPMSQVYLEGQAYSRTASGTAPWWVLISGALVFVGSSMIIVLATGDFILILTSLPFLALIVMIVWRGTRAKLIAQKQKEQRQSRREIAMRE